jgi:hypothetical protein
MRPFLQETHGLKKKYEFFNPVFHRFCTGWGSLGRFARAACGQFLQCGDFAHAPDAHARGRAKRPSPLLGLGETSLALPKLLAPLAPTAFDPRVQFLLAQRSVRLLRTKHIAQVLEDRAHGLCLVGVLCSQISCAEPLGSKRSSYRPFSFTMGKRSVVGHAGQRIDLLGTNRLGAPTAA